MEYIIIQESLSIHCLQFSVLCLNSSVELNVQPQQWWELLQACNSLSSWASEDEVRSPSHAPDCVKCQSDEKKLWKTCVLPHCYTFIKIIYTIGLCLQCPFPLFSILKCSTFSFPISFLLNSLRQFNDYWNNWIKISLNCNPSVCPQQ